MDGKNFKNKFIISNNKSWSSTLICIHHDFISEFEFIIKLAYNEYGKHINYILKVVHLLLKQI